MLQKEIKTVGKTGCARKQFPRKMLCHTAKTDWLFLYSILPLPHSPPKLILPPFTPPHILRPFKFFAVGVSTNGFVFVFFLLQCDSEGEDDKVSPFFCYSLLFTNLRLNGRLLLRFLRSVAAREIGKF